jgi:hypothetical protein
MAPPHPTRFAQPAIRMFHDAEALRDRAIANQVVAAGNDWLGTPDHLYGLACECALKAILVAERIITQDPPQDPFMKHVDQLWKEYHVARSGRSASLSMIPAISPFGAWRASHRYKPNSFFDTARLDQHREGARAGMLVLQHAISNGLVVC